MPAYKDTPCGACQAQPVMVDPMDPNHLQCDQCGASGVRQPDERILWTNAQGFPIEQ